MPTLYVEGSRYEHAAALTPFLDHVTMLGYRLKPLGIAVEDPPKDQPGERFYFTLGFASQRAVADALRRLNASRAASPARLLMSTAIIGHCRCVSSADPATAKAGPGRFLVFWDNVHGRLLPAEVKA